MIKVYLAGPDVFRPDALAIAERKKSICRRHGLVGLFPLDADVGSETRSPAARAQAIYRANLSLMDEAAAILAELAPFRGPSADAGTAFELGYMRAQHKPVFAYGDDGRDYLARTRSFLGLAPDASRDADGLTIEDFGLPDNLMLIGALRDTGAHFVAAAGHDPYEVFEEVVGLAAAHLRHDR